jgi:hypothetical protein
MRFLGLLGTWEWGSAPMVVRLAASRPEELADPFGTERDAAGALAELDRKSRAMGAAAKIERGLLSAIQQRFAAVRGGGSGSSSSSSSEGGDSAKTHHSMYLVAVVQQPHCGQAVTAQVNADPFARSRAAHATHTGFSSLLGKDGKPLSGAEAAAVAGAGASTAEAAAVAARWAVIGQEHEPLWTEQR